MLPRSDTCYTPIIKALLGKSGTGSWNQSLVWGQQRPAPSMCVCVHRYMQILDRRPRPALGMFVMSAIQVPRETWQHHLSQDCIFSLSPAPSPSRKGPQVALPKMPRQALVTCFRLCLRLWSSSGYRGKQPTLCQQNRKRLMENVRNFLSRIPRNPPSV